MANPRDIVKFDGIGRHSQTFEIDGVTITFDRNQPNGSAQVGKAVKMSTHKTVELTTDGSDVVGKLENVESDGKCSVQTEDYVDYPGGASATLTLGNKIVGALGPSSAKGYVRAVNTAVPAELGRARGMIVDASDTTKVMVKMT